MASNSPNDRALKRPIDLIKIDSGVKGSGPNTGKLALVKGYLSMSPSDARDNAVWAESIRAAGWKGDIYQLRWESGHTNEIIRSIGLSLLLRMGLKLAARRVLLPLPPVGIYELSEIRRHWRAARQRAETANVPALLELLSDEADPAEWTLLGHSLGGRIVFNMLAREAGRDAPFRDAVLAGATVSHSDQNWPRAATAVANEIVNVYHPGDRVLSWLFRATEFNRINPCGRIPVAIDHARIRNIDASQWLKKSFRSHMQYHEILPHAVTPHLWTTPAPLLLPYQAEEESPS